MLGDVLSITLLPSGSTGSSYLVATGSGRFVAKQFDHGSDALLGPAEQFALLGVLADVGIAPRPIAFDEGARVLVTEFLEGAAPLSSESLRRPGCIEAAARCLLRLHAVDVDVPRFAPAVYAERYVANAGGPQSLSKRDRERHEELRDLALAFDGHPATLCHNDLLAENLLVGDDGLKLIDFDYAVTAPPVVDLASLVVMNDFSEGETSALLDAYFGCQVPSLPLEFAKVKRVVRLLAHFWALASGDAGAAIVARYRIEDDRSK
ncbi:MAG TPA: choline/ethanolamine kinase family protein [Gammaproteobacteria bacterium]|nr:choline/ethanolamine kinase family protein [Gammaproteobacteria bacterium]